MVDIHAQDVTVEILRNELRRDPARLEEVSEGTADTPLTAAVRFQNSDAVTFLLEFGANVHVTVNVGSKS